MLHMQHPIVGPMDPDERPIGEGKNAQRSMEADANQKDLTVLGTARDLTLSFFCRLNARKEDLNQPLRIKARSVL